MGYQTDYVGYLRMDPPLNESESDLINAISGSLLLDPRRSGPRSVGEDEAALNALRERAPRGWSNWTVCPQGCCLSYDGGDKANHMVPWLRFLMDSLLVSGADVEAVPYLHGLTFDHVLNGMVVGSRRDTRELYSITVRDNEVEIELLWPGHPAWSSYPPLKYQVAIDRFRTWLVEQPDPF